MGYKMFEITSEQKEGIIGDARKAISCLEDMLEKVEEACDDGQMGQRMGMRDDDEWYIRKMNRERMGYRDDYDRIGERRGVRGTGRYGMRSGYRDPYFE